MLHPVRLSVRLSVTCLRFSRSRKAAYKLLIYANIALDKSNRGANLRSKGQRTWSLGMGANVSIVLCSYQTWIDLRQTKTEMMSDQFYTYRLFSPAEVLHFVIFCNYYPAGSSGLARTRSSCMRVSGSSVVRNWWSSGSRVVNSSLYYTCGCAHAAGSTHSVTTRDMFHVVQMQRTYAVARLITDEIVFFIAVVESSSFVLHVTPGRVSCNRISFLSSLISFTL